MDFINEFIENPCVLKKIIIPQIPTQIETYNWPHPIWGQHQRGWWPPSFDRMVTWLPGDEGTGFYKIVVCIPIRFLFWTKMVGQLHWTKQTKAWDQTKQLSPCKSMCCRTHYPLSLECSTRWLSIRGAALGELFPSLYFQYIFCIVHMYMKYQSSPMWPSSSVSSLRVLTCLHQYLCFVLPPISGMTKFFEG